MESLAFPAEVWSCRDSKLTKKNAPGPVFLCTTNIELLCIKQRIKKKLSNSKSKNEFINVVIRTKIQFVCICDGSAHDSRIAHRRDIDKVNGEALL